MHDHKEAFHQLHKNNTYFSFHKDHKEIYWNFGHQKLSIGATCRISLVEVIHAY